MSKVSSQSKLSKQELKSIINSNGDIKSFDDVGVSTKTIIAISNIIIDLEKLYTYVPITEYNPIEKKRGRKKRLTIEPIIKILPQGSIILTQRKNEHRGVLLKNKCKDNNTFFLHSVTIVLSLENNKFINIKVSSNGKFQITGCKNKTQYIDTILHIFIAMINIETMTGEKCYKFNNSDSCLKVIFNTVMQNMDFNIGFNISRDKLDKFINCNTQFVSIFEGSISTGVNVKIKSEQVNDAFLTELQYDIVDKTVNIVKVPYINYFNLLEDKEKKKEGNKEKHHTFLIFASGSIIMSSRGPDMKRVFNKLINILLDNKHKFEDKTIENEKIITEITHLE